MGHFHRLQRFGQRANLVHLHQNGIRRRRFDALAQAFRVSHEKIIAHQLHLGADAVRQQLPAGPIIF